MKVVMWIAVTLADRDRKKSSSNAPDDKSRRRREIHRRTHDAVVAGIVDSKLDEVLDDGLEVFRDLLLIHLFVYPAAMLAVIVAPADDEAR